MTLYRCRTEIIYVYIYILYRPLYTHFYITNNFVEF